MSSALDRQTDHDVRMYHSFGHLAIAVGVQRGWRFRARVPQSHVCMWTRLPYRLDRSQPGSKFGVAYQSHPALVVTVA